MNQNDAFSLPGPAPASAPVSPRPAGRRRLVRGTLAVLAVVAVAGLAATLGPRLAARPQAASDKDKPAVALDFTEAEVTRPQRLAMPLGIEFSGPLMAPRTVVIRAKAAGTLLSLNAVEGGRVKAGQTLGEIDIAELRSRVNERTAGVDTAQAAVLEAERQHAANTGLAAQNFISSTALQSSQAKLDSARAQVKAAAAQLSTSRILIHEAQLTAPLAGVVGKRHVVPGERVAAEQALLTVVDLTTLELAGMVGTHEVSLVKPGQAVQVQVEGRAAPVAGRIDRIAPAAEAGTRAIGVVVTLANPDESLRAGQYAQARLQLADDTPRLALPMSALGQASGQDFVWTLERNALVRRIVITGRRDVAGGRVEVLRGVEPDAQVLASRFEGLKEGAPARVVASRAAPGVATPTPTAVPAMPASARS